MKSDFFELNLILQEQQEHWQTLRAGEVRIGERIHFRSSDSNWKKNRYHILGINEDFGPRTNFGKKGARFGFNAFITRFLAMQSNEFLRGDSICVHGSIESTLTNDQLKPGIIEDLDGLVTAWTTEVIQNGGIPIVIGGGHNNAYGLIKGTSLAKSKSINVVNLDPHADTRALEGRHSGNPFSYAFEEGFLEHYSVLGLHESYNNQFILDYLRKINARFSFLENWIDQKNSFEIELNGVVEIQRNKEFGLELDMDSIQNMPSSAFTPSGITVEMARKYIRTFGALENVCYLHLPEAAPVSEHEELIVGKALAYLVSDFIKSNSNQSK